MFFSKTSQIAEGGKWLLSNDVKYKSDVLDNYKTLGDMYWLKDC